MPVQRGQLVLLVAVLSHVSGQENTGVTFKCCGVNEHLDSFSKCVNASWVHADTHPSLAEIGVKVANDEAWMARWYPPGRPRDVLVRKKGFVVHSLLSESRPSTYRMTHRSYVLKEYSLMAAVQKSYFYEDPNENGDWPRSVVMYNGRLLRFDPRGNPRVAAYCVDAIEKELGPYAVVFRTIPVDGDLFSKCCRLGQVLVSPTSGSLQCDADSRAWTTFLNSSLSLHFDAETPFREVKVVFENVPDPKVKNQRFQTTKIPPGDTQFAKYVQQFSVEFLSSTWMYPCVDLEREENGDVTEVLGYFLVTRHTRAAYLITRNLSFVSALILVAALVAISFKERMRSAAHGWALGCHIVCLLFFNVGQILYYMTMSDVMDMSGPYGQKGRKSSGTCLAFAIPMYFLLTSANVWMAAVSANMFLGFKLVRNNQGAGAARAAKTGERKRFLKLSAFAWSIAAALTAVSAVAFLTVPDEMAEREGEVEARAWYRPSFTETRTCYMEVGFSKFENLLSFRSQKLGTTLYYYVPTLALVAANGAFLWLTGRKVRYLRRGNSLLKRDEREGGGGRRGGGRQQDKSASEPKSATVYIKLLLAGGVLEFLAESLTWAVSSYHPWTSQPSHNEIARSWQTVAELMTFQLKDHMHSHRVTGYCADFFRALVVLWLAVPEPPDVRAAWRRMRGMGGDSPAAPRPAPRPAARRGQQESEL